MHYASKQDLNSLDQLAVQNGLSIKQMMELAGWHGLSVFERMGWTSDKKVLVVVGTGNKGGDGLCLARHLINYGYIVSVVLLDKNIKADPAQQLELLKKIKAPLYYFSESSEVFRAADIIVDALLGYNIDGEPRGYYAEAIKEINTAKVPVVSFDLPSGMDAGSGQISKNTVRAAATLTLAWPKKSFQFDQAHAYCGRVFLADVGIPPYVYDHVVPASRPAFGGRGLVEL